MPTDGAGRPRYPPEALPVDGPPPELGRVLRRGAIWAIGTQGASQVVRMLSVVVLARLLTPDDYGTAALAITVASYSGILGDFGYGTALVQARTAPQRVASTAWWSAVGAGMVGALVVALAAYPVARIVDEEAAAPLLIAGGSTLFLVALGSTSNALLTRALKFPTLQATGAVAGTLAAGCAIIGAAAGLGAWALILQQVALAATVSALFIVAARWHPSLEFSRIAFSRLSKFALPYTAGSIFAILQALLTAVLIGRWVGIAELGLWTLSMATVVIPLQLIAAPLGKMMYAAFARLRGEEERVAEIWLSGTALLALAVLPSLFGLIALAPDFVPFIFGDQWTEAVPLVQILCFLFLLRSLQTWNIAVMDAAGRPQVNMLLGAGLLLITPVSVALGSARGIEGVAVAYVIGTLLFGELPSFVITTRQLALPTRTVLKRLRGVVLASVLMCTGVVMLRAVLTNIGVPTGIRITILIVFGGGLYIGLVALLDWPLARRFVRTLTQASPEA